MLPRRGVSRRRFLLSSLCAGGAGLGLGDILRLRSCAADSGAVPDTSVIQIWLGGGPSQFETFDPKPQAAAEIRGPYQAIRSSLPGVAVCEMLPLTAAVLDRTAIVRSFTHPFDDHFGVTPLVPGRTPRARQQQRLSIVGGDRVALSRPATAGHAAVCDAGRRAVDASSPVRRDGAGLFWRGPFAVRRTARSVRSNVPARSTGRARRGRWNWPTT